MLLTLCSRLQTGGQLWVGFLNFHLLREIPAFLAERILHGPVASPTGAGAGGTATSICFKQVRCIGHQCIHPLGQLYSAFGGWAGANGALTFLKRSLQIYENEASTDPTTEAALITRAEGWFTTVYSGTQLALMQNLFRGIAYYGVKDCEQSRTVYRRRIMAASFNQVQAGFVGVGQIWTTAEILAFENVPSSWWFQLPSTLQWFKSPPRVLTVAQQKTEIEYSYQAVFKAWSGVFTAYGSATLLTF